MVNKENTKIFQKRQLKWDSIILKLIQKKNFTGIKHGFVEDPLGMHRTPSNETLISEIPNMITERNVVIAAMQEQKKQIQFFEEQAFSYLLLKSKFGYNTSWANPLRALWYLIKYFWNLTSALHQVRITYFWLGMFISRAPYDYQ